MKSAETQRALDCVAQHIKSFREQALNAQIADFGESCQKCTYAGACNYDWSSIMIPLLQESSISISMVSLKQRDKQGIVQNDPDLDKDILR